MPEGRQIAKSEPDRAVRVVASVSGLSYGSRENMMCRPGALPLEQS